MTLVPALTRTRLGIGHPDAAILKDETWILH